jgi:hypothetical protein
MNAVAMIKALDVIEDRQLSFVSAHKVMVMHPLVFQVEAEALRHCIVVRRLSTLYARAHSGLSQ